MRVVADSHSLLYYLFTPDRLSEPAFDALGNAEKSDGLVVSAATLGDLWYSSHKIGERALTPGAFESLHTTVLDPENEGFEVPVESGRSLGGVLGDGATESAALIEEATIDAYGVDDGVEWIHAYRRWAAEGLA